MADTPEGASAPPVEADPVLETSVPETSVPPALVSAPDPAPAMAAALHAPVAMAGAMVETATAELAEPPLAELARKPVVDTLQLTESALRQATGGAVREFDDLFGLARQSADVWLAANHAWLRGAERSAAALGTFNQRAMERHLAAAQALIGAKTLREMTELQSRAVQEDVDAWIAVSGVLGEIVSETSGAVAEPVTRHLQDLAQRLRPGA